VSGKKKKNTRLALVSDLPKAGTEKTDREERDIPSRFSSGRVVGFRRRRRVKKKLHSSKAGQRAKGAQEVGAGSIRCAVPPVGSSTVGWGGQKKKGRGKTSRCLEGVGRTGDVGKRVLDLAEKGAQEKKR